MSIKSKITNQIDKEMIKEVMARPDIQRAVAVSQLIALLIGIGAGYFIGKFA